MSTETWLRETSADPRPSPLRPPEFKFADIPDVTIDQVPTNGAQSSNPDQWKQEQMQQSGSSADQPYRTNSTGNANAGGGGASSPSANRAGEQQQRNPTRGPTSAYTGAAARTNKPSRASSSAGTDDTFVGGNRGRAI